MAKGDAAIRMRAGQGFPNPGTVVLLPTPAGLRWFRVATATTVRVTLIALTAEESAGLMQAVRSSQPRRWWRWWRR